MDRDFHHADDKRVMYLRCGRCTACIGPGYLQDEVWFDPSVNRKICRGCADDRDGTYRLLTAQELAASGGGSTLVRLMKERQR